MSASSFWLARHVVRRGAQDEEGHHVDRGVALQPLPQRADVVRRPSRDVQHAHALARHVERHQTSVVVRDGVAGGRRDRDLDDARAGALESDGEIDASPCRPSRGRRPAASSAGGPSSRSSRAVTVSRRTSARPPQPTSTRRGSGTCATAAPAALTRRTLASGGASRVVATVSMGTCTASAQRPQARLRCVLRRVVQTSVAHDHHCRRPLLGRGGQSAQRRAEVAVRCARRQFARPARSFSVIGSGCGAPSPNPSTVSRALVEALASASSARSRACHRGPPGWSRAIDRDVSASTTTRAPDDALSRRRRAPAAHRGQQRDHREQSGRRDGHAAALATPHLQRAA